MARNRETHINLRTRFVLSDLLRDAVDAHNAGDEAAAAALLAQLVIMAGGQRILHDVVARQVAAVMQPHL
jgi:hypothetical protein